VRVPLSQGVGPATEARARRGGERPSHDLGVAPPSVLLREVQGAALEDHTEFQGGLTHRLARRLVAEATVVSIRAVSRHHGVEWHRITRLVSKAAARVAERRRVRPTRVSLVDETSISRLHW